MTETFEQCPDHRIDTQGSDSYSFNEDKGVGHCLSCGLNTWLDEEGKLWGRVNRRETPKLIRNVPDSPSDAHTGDLDPFDEEHYPMTEDTAQAGSYEYVTSRNITKETKKFYDIRTYRKVESKVQHPKTKQWYTFISDEEHAIYPNGSIKGRRLDLEKDHWAHFFSRGPLDCFFAQNLFPAGCSKRLTIVEGDHYDTPSAYQMLNRGNYLNPVVSVPGAKPSGKFWEKTKKYLDSFDEIILSVDNDEAGLHVAEVMFDLYPGKIYLMNHADLKDASDFLQADRGQDYVNAWFKRTKFSPTGFISGPDAWFKALDEENPYTYMPTPIEAFNEVGRGIVKGGITILKAPPGSGKSSLLRWLEYDQVKNKGCKVAVLMMEEMTSITGRSMATQALGKNVMTREDAENNLITEQEVKEALYDVVSDDKFISFEVNPQDPVEDTLNKCKQAVLYYGVDFIYIDHLQRLAYLSGTDKATANLTELGVKLTEFAKRKDIGIVCISHVNEDGHTKYARAIEEEAIVLIELSRDKESEDYDKRNTSYLTITKNRPFGATGAAGALTYDPESTILSENTGPIEPPTPKYKDDF